MIKTRQIKVPLPVYDFLKCKAKENNTTIKMESKNMMEGYLNFKKLEELLNKKRGKSIFILK
jgi:uncharacterized protein YunC (DUF1805 family)